MAISLSALRFRHWLLLVLFVTAAGASGFFASKLIVHTLYWSSPERQEPIEGWMTLGYVAHAHEVPAWVLYQALDLPTGVPDRRPLGEIADSRGLPLDALRLRLEHAIAAARPPNPPPEPRPPREDPS